MDELHAAMGVSFVTNRKRAAPKWWTTAEVRIVRACLPHCTYAEIGSYLGRSGRSVKGYCERNGMVGVERGVGHKVGRSKGDSRNRINFRPGSDPMPIGTELRTKRGIMVSVAPARWKRKAVVVWEASGRTIPEGSILIHVDRDKFNCDLSNLAVVTRADSIRMNAQRADQAARYAKISATRIRRNRYHAARSIYVAPFIKAA